MKANPLGREGAGERVAAEASFDAQCGLAGRKLRVPADFDRSFQHCAALEDLVVERRGESDGGARGGSTCWGLRGQTDGHQQKKEEKQTWRRN